MPEIIADKEYIKSLKAILQIVAAVLSIVGFICACIWGSNLGFVNAGGYAQFATIVAFLVALGFFFVNLFMQSIPNYKPMGQLVEWILYVVFTVLLVIAGIVAAAFAAKYTGYRYPLRPVQDAVRNKANAAAATSAFSFVAAVVFGVLAFFGFRDWSASRGLSTTTTTTTTTTTAVQ